MKGPHASDIVAPSSGAITDLLAKLEAATGLTAKLFWEVADTFIPEWGDGDSQLHSRVAGYVDAGAWTDASLALVERVLPGWVVGLDQQAPDHWEAVLSKSSGRFLIEADGEVFGSAKTPAIALLIALIRALRDGDHKSSAPGNSGTDL